jgi:hypothetical protein
MTETSFLYDGAVDFLGGQDASVIPDRIAENCYASGINVSVRRGSIQPRWGFRRLDFTVEEGELPNKYLYKKTYKELFETGKFQALAPYYVGDDKYLIIVVGGLIFAYSLNTEDISYIKIADGTYLNSRATRINWTPAGQYLILYDFPAQPVIIDRLKARRSVSSAMEIPSAVLGAFNQNRLFIGNAGTEFTGSDPVGSTATPYAPLTFAEVEMAQSAYYGQIFKLPTVDHNNPITFMGFLQVTDTSTGIGPLIVGTSTALYSYATQNPRANWEQGPFGTIICYNAGIVSPRSFVNVNSDAFFLSGDGYVRSLSMSRDEQHRWARVPISREVENWFKFTDEELKRVSFAASFKNKVFFSVNPYRMPAVDFDTGYPISDFAHGGLAVLELDSLTSFGTPSKPVWTGLWTGINPMDMAVFDDRAFLMSKDASNINRLYEMDASINHDIAECKIRQIRSRVYTRELDFKDPFLNKELHSVDFNFDSIKGDFKLDVQYKPSHAPGFFPWRVYTHKAPWRSTSVPTGCFLNGYAYHHIRDLTLGAPLDDLCSPITRDYYKVFRKVQLELTFEGQYWELHEFRIKAIPRPQLPTQSVCEELPKVAVCDVLNDDWCVEDYLSCKELVT